MSLLKIFQFRFPLFAVISVLVLGGVTVASAQSPDLISQNLTFPPSIIETQSVQFSGQVKNQGDAIAAGTVASWSQVGNSLSLSNITGPALATLGLRRVAFIDRQSNQLRTYFWNDVDWNLLGTPLSLGAGGGYPALAALNSTDIAFIDSGQDQLRTYRFDNTTFSWSQIGNSLAVNAADVSVLAALNNTDVAFIDNANKELRTYRFNGTNWSQVGNGLPINFGGPFGFTGGTALATLNAATDVAFVGFFEDTFNNQLHTYRWDGTNWSKVGNSLSLNSAGIPALAALPNSTDVVFSDDDTHQLRTYRFDGTNWSQWGNSLAVGTVGHPALANLSGSSDVAFVDSTSDLLRTFTPLSQGPFTARFCIDNPNCLTTTTGRIGGDLSVSPLVAGASSPSLLVSWIAAAPAAGPHNLYLCADVGDLVVESAEGSVSNCDSIPFTVLSAPVLPDVIVTDFTVPDVPDVGPGQVVNAQVTIKNDTAVAITTPFKVAVQVNWLGAAGVPIIACNAPMSGSVTVPSLGAGATLVVNVPVTLPSPPSTQTYTAAAKVDWECVINEYDEFESDLTDDYVVTVVPGGQPDLIVPPAQPDIPAALFGGESITFTGQIQNIGTGNAIGSFHNMFQIDVGADNPLNPEINLNAPNSITDLNAGDTEPLLVASEPWSVTVGTHAVRLCADLADFVLPPGADIPNGLVSESNENNNCGDWREIEVLTAPPVLPDLIILPNSLSKTPLLPLAPVVGNSVTFHGKVKNQGQAETNAWAWSGVSLALPIIGGSSPAIAALTSTDVAFIDSGSNQLRTYHFDGISNRWVLKGSLNFAGNVGFSALTALNGTDVAFYNSDSGRLRTYRYNFATDTWTQLNAGLGLPITGAGSLGLSALAALNGTDVAFYNSQTNRLRTYRFNGTNWSQVCSGGASCVGLPVGAFFGMTFPVALTALNGTDVAFYNGFTDEDNLRTLRFDFTTNTWSQPLGTSPLEIDFPGSPGAAMAALNGTDVAFVQSTNGVLRTYRFNGVTWSEFGDDESVGGGPQVLAALDENNLDENNVALFSGTGPTNYLQTYRFSNAGNPFGVRFCIDSVDAAGCLLGTSGELIPELEVPALGADSISSDFSNTWTATVGVHTIYLCADPYPPIGGTVTESAEGALSNCDSMLLLVVAADLEVTEFIIPNGTPGEVVSASVTVKNTGNIPVNAVNGPFDVGINMTTDMSGACFSDPVEDFYAVPPVFSLAVDATKTLTIPVTLPATGGSYTAYAMADSDCDIDFEADETNNTRPAGYTVNAPMLATPVIAIFETENELHLVKRGLTKTFDYTVTDATYIEITSSDGSPKKIIGFPGPGPFGTMTGQVVTDPIYGRTTYTINAWNEYPGGPQAIPKSVTISLIPNYLEI